MGIGEAEWWWDEAGTAEFGVNGDCRDHGSSASDAEVVITPA